MTGAVGGSQSRHDQSFSWEGKISDFILKTVDLTKQFHGFTAVDRVNLEVKRHSIHALIGPNGAGKTTVFNLITKFLQPTAGRIVFNDDDITNAKPEDIALKGMVRSFQISAVFPHLSVRENVRLALQRPLGNWYKFWQSDKTLDALNERADDLIESVCLAEFSNITAVELSYGRKRALEIVTTLALDPEMMLLDEPTAGMGHEDIDRVVQLIQKVAANRTVLMVEHNLSVVSTLCDTITVLTRGRVLAEGSYADVSGNPEVRAAYMGTGHTSQAAAISQLADTGGTKDVALQLDGLNAFYGESHVLHGVNLEVRRGELVTLVGRNGAGKTTILRAIMGLVSSTGSIRLSGNEIIALPPEAIAHLGVGYVPEERGIFSSLTVEENLMLPPNIRPGGMSVRDIYELFPNLEERRKSQGTKLSGGEQQMLAIGRILRTGADFVLLDEPTEGLAPVIIQQIGEAILTLKKMGLTILLVEQNFHFACTIADRHYVVEEGNVIDMIPNGLLGAPETIDKLNRYLGV